jgi:hypothetical protein
LHHLFPYRPVGTLWYSAVKMHDVNPEAHPMGYESGRDLRPIMMQNIVIQMNDRQSHTQAQLQAFSRQADGAAVDA